MSAAPASKPPMAALPPAAADTEPVWQSPLTRFPFPLRESMNVYLTLPRDITADEADRLAAYIRSLVRPTGRRSDDTASQWGRDSDD